MSIEKGNQNEQNSEWKAPKGKSVGRKIWDRLKKPVFRGAQIMAVGAALSPELIAEDKVFENIKEGVKTGKDLVVEIKDANTRRRQVDADERTRTAEISANAGVELETVSTGKGVKIKSGDVYGTPWERSDRARTSAEENMQKGRLEHERKMKQMETEATRAQREIQELKELKKQK